MTDRAGGDSPLPVAVVSQWLLRTHGQGRINLEMLRAFSAAGHSTTAIATAADPGAGTVRRVAIPARLPTNWARETVFRHAGGSLVRSWQRQHGRQGLVVSNGAAVTVAGDVNVAMFVHAAWLASAWHPARRNRSWYGRYQAAYNAYNIPLERRAFNCARRIVALNELVRDELIDHHSVPPEKIVCIQPGVDTDEFRSRRPDEPNALRQACGLSDAYQGGPAMLTMFAGEIRTGRKNLDLVLRMLVALPTVHLAVAGATAGSPYPKLAKELGVADRVHWLGHRFDLPHLYRGADVFVLPSHYEPFGLVVTEALASGVPAIVTRQCGAAASVPSDGGIVLDTGADLETLVEVLRVWEREPAARGKAGLAARASVEHYTWRDMGAAYSCLIDTLAS